MRRFVIDYIGMISAFKVGCFMTVIPSCLCGIIAASTFITMSKFSTQSVLAVWGAAVPWLFYLLLAGFFGGVGLFLQALIYNIGATIFGGLRFNLRDIDVQPSTTSPSDDYPTKSQFEYPDEPRIDSRKTLVRWQINERKEYLEAKDRLGE